MSLSWSNLHVFHENGWFLNKTLPYDIQNILNLILLENNKYMMYVNICKQMLTMASARVLSVGNTVLFGPQHPDYEERNKLGENLYLRNGLISIFSSNFSKNYQLHPIPLSLVF